MIADFINNLVPTLQHFGIFNYWIILLVYFLEALVFIGLIIPGAVVAVIIGALAAQGIFHLGDAIVFASVGFLLGDILSYYLGRKGTGFFKDENKILKYAHIEKAEIFFKKHGSKSVFLGRFIGFLRPLTPFVAGIAKMKIVKFLILDSLSVAIWVSAHFLVGYFFGQAFGLLKIWTSRAELFLAFLTLFLLIFYFLKWLVFKKGFEFLQILISFINSGWQTLISKPVAKKLFNKYPKTFLWLDKRFTQTNFTGLPLSFSFLFLIYLIYRFSNLTFNILHNGLIIQIDNRFENLIYSFRSPPIIKVFLILTNLGSLPIITALTIGFSIYLWLNKKKLHIVSLWFLTVGTSLSNTFFKFLIHRPRPTTGYYLESSYSFPSFHAAAATAFFGFIIYNFWRGNKSWQKKVNTLFAGLLMIIIIAFSRVYLGVHYLSDVLGGFQIGMIWLTITLCLNEYLIYKSRNIEEGRILKNLWNKTIIYFIIILEISFFATYSIINRTKININRIEPESTIVTTDIIKTFNDLNLSRYTETLDGETEEPLNFIITADSDQKLMTNFKDLQWFTPDKPNLKSFSKMLRDITLNRNYPKAPMAPSFWQAEVNDISLEKPTVKNSIRQRHHFKIWKTEFKTPNNKSIYVGVAGLDVGTEWWVAHKIDPNIDAEREFLFNELNNKKFVASWSRINFVLPTIGKKLLGDQFFTDGKLYIVDLN